MIDSQALEIRKIINAAGFTDHPEDARPVIEIEIQTIARDCMGKMEPVAVRDYCRHLNSLLDDYFTRDELDPSSHRCGTRKNSVSAGSHSQGRDTISKFWKRKFSHGAIPTPSNLGFSFLTVLGAG